MTYRRDAIPEESIPLPFETVYNSEADAVKDEDFLGRLLLWNSNRVYGNRIYFKYPPEWKTSNVGEKIIGIRNMFIHRKEGDLKFTLYVRKYNQTLIPRSMNNKVNQDRINAIPDDQLNDNMKIFVIPINVRVTRYDTWPEIKEKILNKIRQENIYNYIYRRLKSLYDLPDELVPKLEQLEQIKHNYHAMLQSADALILEHIPFYLEPDDVDLVTTVINNKVCLTFASPCNNRENHAFYIDFAMTALDEYDINSTYKKWYQVGPNEELSGKELAEPGNLDAGDWMDGYTSDFFCLYTGAEIKFQRMIQFKNMMTDLQCEVAASFATQSNHNIIGRTNETYTPIKYYKINDDNEQFWIEFYDRDNVLLPLTFNDCSVFTIDMVFLQNRKLLYS